LVLVLVLVLEGSEVHKRQGLEPLLLVDLVQRRQASEQGLLPLVGSVRVPPRAALVLVLVALVQLRLLVLVQVLEGLEVHKRQGLEPLPLVDLELGLVLVVDLEPQKLQVLEARVVLGQLQEEVLVLVQVDLALRVGSAVPRRPGLE
jgi:hypothetical protein